MNIFKSIKKMKEYNLRKKIVLAIISRLDSVDISSNYVNREAERMIQYIETGQRPS
jgi:hypothetical protein